MLKLITNSLETLLTPPGLIVVMLISAYLLRQRYPRGAKYLGISATALLFLISIPLFPVTIINLLESSTPPLQVETLKQTPARAIIILGGGRYANAPEYGGADTVGRYALERLRYGAHLHRASGLPLLLTGGSVYGERKSEAELMAESLTTDFHLTARWVEGQSRTTWENAQYSKALLAKEGIDTVILVTHALHMPRSIYAFEQAGLKVIPAAHNYHVITDEEPLLLWLLPNADAIKSNMMLFHEVLGRVWYWLRS